MRQINQCLIMLTLFLCCSGCKEVLHVDTNAKYIEEVQNMTVNVFELSTQVGEGVAKMAGIEGSVNWSVFKPKEYTGNGNITCVQARVVGEGKGKKKKTHTAVLQFLVNSDTGLMKLSSYTVDGKAKSHMDAKVDLIAGAIGL
jgi:hypothetical protein